MMEGMMQAVRDWTKKIIESKIRTELRIFRVTANKVEDVHEYDIQCGRYGDQDFSFTHIYVEDEKQEFRDSDMLIISIPDDAYPRSTMGPAPIFFHINGKEYLTTTYWIDVRDYEERRTSYRRAESLYESNTIQNVTLDKTQSITISLKKAVNGSGDVYEYATALDNLAPTNVGTDFQFSTAASYGDLKELKSNFTTYGLQTIEHGSFTNGTISIELDGLTSMYLLFTQERAVATNAIYGYRARLIVENPGKAPSMTEFVKTTNAGVTIAGIVSGMTLKATSAYEVKYVLYKIRGAS